MNSELPEASYEASYYIQVGSTEYEGSGGSQGTNGPDSRRRRLPKTLILRLDAGQGPMWAAVGRL